MDDKKIKNGLGLLKTLESVPDEVERLIAQNKFPPLFLKYLKYFEMGNNYFVDEKVLINKFEKPISIISYKMELNTNFDYSQKIPIFLSYKDYLEEKFDFTYHLIGDKMKRFVKIASSELSDEIILIGVTVYNLDEIWVLESSNSVNINKIADNIFIFMNSITQSLNYEIINKNNIDINSLFLKFGEDFWRVREK